MPLLADRVRETSATTGTGTLTLAGAVAGYQGFNAAFANADTVYYVIQYATEWEVGIGTVGTGTLSRDSVLASSNADALVPFSAGTKDVFCAYVAERAVTTSDAATLTNKTIDDITNLVGADHIHYKIKANATITKGQTLKAVGYNAGQAAIEVEPISSASDIAVGIAYQDLASGDFGAAINTGLLIGVKTDFAGWALGDVLYPDPSTGGLTKTKPTSGTYQACAYVMRVQSNNGVLLCEFTEPQQVMASTNTANTAVLRDGSGNFAAGTVTAALTGNASTATALATARNINGVSFNGTADITVTAAAGTLSGSTLAAGVTASSLTSVGTLGSLTVTNPITGSVTGSSGSTTGNAATATTLQTARNINGVSFNGSADITVTAAAGTLSGSTLASGVTASSLTSVGTLTALTVSGNTNIGTTGGVARLTVSAAAASTGNGIDILRNGYTARFRLGSQGATDADFWITNNYNPSTGLAESAEPANIKIAANNTWSVLTAATTRLLVDASGNVGIGTASPTASLQIGDSTGLRQAVINGGGYDLVLGASGGGLFGFASQAISLVFSTASVPLGIGTNAAQPLILGTGGTERARIDASGNFGLGVTPSAWATGCTAFQLDSYSALFESVAGRTSLAFNARESATNSYVYLQNEAATMYQQVSGAHQWYTAASGTAGNAISFAQDMTLASGNLSLREAGAGFTNGGVIRDGNGSTGVRFYGASDGNLTLFNTVNSASFGNIVFSTNNGTQAERARIDASGNLLVGDSAATGAVISGYSAADGIIRIRGGSGSNQGGAFFVANSAGTQTLAAFGDSARMLGGSVDASVTVFAGNVPLTFYVNSVERGRYKTTGQLRFVPLDADPGGAETGDVYYNSSTNKLRVYNGAWVDLH